ncbi:MAG TPA: zinc ribbon domain-containing protein [Chthoniobacteraceae bacterium]|nr:zinc ribbon domain-containing protein [Chthoniobacteraceae bacterium]
MDTLFPDRADMPTYEYQCEKCKKTFEFFQSMKDPALTVCPKEACRQKTWGKGKVKRLLGTGAGLIFKGSGFYITDYRSEGYKAAAKSDSGGGAESKPGESKPAETKGAETKTESKPAAADKPKAAHKKK